MAIGTMTALALGGAALAGGAGIAQAARGNRDKVDNQFLMNPEYAENTGARELWWKRLQEWGNDPNYGAISPDWSNIWENVQNKVRQYYEGGPLKPGVKDRVRASLARRGMSENPASDYLLAQTDVAQGNELANIATEQGIAKAQFGEQGRLNWLQSLQDLEARKPEGQWQTTIRPDKTNAIWGSIGNLGSTMSSAAIGIQGAQGQNDLLKNLNRDPMALSGMNSPWGATNRGFQDGINRSLLNNRFSARRF